MKRQLEAAFGGWRKAAVAAPVATAMAARAGRRVLLVDKPGATQTYFWLGNVGADRTDPARARAVRWSTRCSADGSHRCSTPSFGSRAASATARAPASRGSRSRATSRSLPTRRPRRRPKPSISRLRRSIGCTREGVDADALASAKSYLLGQFPTAIETNGQLATRLADIVFFGLDRDDVDEYAARVSAVDCRRRRRDDRAATSRNRATLRWS